MTQDGGDFAALDRHDWGTADDYMVLATQGTTHVDGLAHVWSGGQLYNGFPFTEVRSSGAGRLGLGEAGRHGDDGAPLRRQPSAGRRPARDHAPTWSSSCSPVVPRRPEPGDAVLFRTGWMEDGTRR